MDWPKCEKCDGTGKRYAYLSPGDCDDIRRGYRPEPEKETCYYCHGTGEGELTVDQAAEIIWDCGWRVTEVFKTQDGLRWVGVEEIWGYRCHFSENGKTLEEAFTAAARAVYERSKA